MVRIFEKPELKNSKAEFSESVFRDPRELEELKTTVKPEVYLKALYSKIYDKERELEELKTTGDATKKALDDSFAEFSAQVKKDTAELESELNIKRSERAELEKPLTERIKAIDAKEQKVIQSELDIKVQEQALFEKDYATETKLNSIKDLSDELAEMRVRLNIREKQHDAKASSLKTKEMEYLVAYQNFREEAAKIRNQFQEREYAIELREMNVQSEKENLVKREKELSNGYILLTDQRGTLERAWDELRRKQK